jgi:hypothetical protein
VAVLLASAVLTGIRGALLNDPNGAIYPDTPMFACMNKAYKELQVKLSALGVSPTKKRFDSIHIPAGTTSISEGALLPDTLLYPTFLRERVWGSTNRYSDMDEQNWNPDVEIGPLLTFWTWQEDKILFPGCTGDVDLVIDGVQSVGSITAGNSTIIIKDCETWLAQRTAAIAALTVGSNPTRAQALNSDLVNIWDDFKSTLVRRKQSIPVRRKRTRYRRPA